MKRIITRRIHVGRVLVRPAIRNIQPGNRASSLRRAPRGIWQAEHSIAPGVVRVRKYLPNCAADNARRHARLAIPRHAIPEPEKPPLAIIATNERAVYRSAIATIPRKESNAQCPASAAIPMNKVGATHLPPASIMKQSFLTKNLALASNETPGALHIACPSANTKKTTGQPARETDTQQREGSRDEEASHNSGVAPGRVSSSAAWEPC